MFLALAAVLVNTVIHVAPAEWQAIAVPVSQAGAWVQVEFDVQGDSHVRVFLADTRQARRFVDGRSYTTLTESGPAAAGRLRHRSEGAVSYALVIDNSLERRRPAAVRVKVEIVPQRMTRGRELPPERRSAVVALSILFFGASVFLSAHLLLRKT